MAVPLTMAIEDYDHVRDLATGLVKPEGVDLTVLNLPVQDIFQRFVAYREWDISEFSFALYTALRSSGDSTITAIPVFPSRVFRHSAVYVRHDGPSAPEQLQGLRVGVAEWAQTAGVWVRGILADDYNVDLASIDWVQGGVHSAGRHERVPLNLPAGLTIRSESDRSLDELLLAGEIDAIITAHAPPSFLNGEGKVRRLFQDHRRAEMDFWQRTKVIPIMHLVVVTADVANRHPWVLRNLQVAFEKALGRSLDRLHDVAISRMPLPWVPETLAELEAMSPTPWWAYGLEENRQAIELFCRYAHEQGVAAKLMTPDELFAPSASFISRI